jgi:hypothetical protein
MSFKKWDRETKIQLWGWFLFVICAGLFIAASIESKSTLSLIGSIVFLVACLVFIYPLVAKPQ